MEVDFKNEILKIISSGKLETAIQKILKELLQDDDLKNTDFFKSQTSQLLLINGQLKENERQHNLGIKSNDQYQLLQNKLSNAFIQFVLNQPDYFWNKEEFIEKINSEDKFVKNIW